MHTAISRLALTAALACGCVSTAAWAQPAAAPAPTAAQAQTFVAAAEKEAFDFSLDLNRAQWVNATFITDDTDALAALFGAQDTEMKVRFALEAAKLKRAPGLSPDLSRKLDLLRTALVLPAPTTPGAAIELNRLSTALQSAYGKGMGTLDGKPINGSDIEAEMGNLNHTPAEYAEMWKSWHDQVGAPMKADISASSRSPMPAPRNWALPTPARCGARAMT